MKKVKPSTKPFKLSDFTKDEKRVKRILKIAGELKKHEDADIKVFRARHRHRYDIQYCKNFPCFEGKECVKVLMCKCRKIKP